MNGNLFEPWSEVECDDCECYWNNQCDGVKEDVTKPCKSYVATRRSNMKEDIDYLKSWVKRLKFSLIVLDIAFIIHLLRGFFV